MVYITYFINQGENRMIELRWLTRTVDIETGERINDLPVVVGQLHPALF